MNAQRKRTAPAAQAADHPSFTDALTAVAQARSAMNDPPQPQPELFRTLETRRVSRDFLGRNWSQPILHRYGDRFARMKNQLRGIAGLSELLYADFQSRQDSDEAEQFGEFLRESLFLALMELTTAADAGMEEVGTFVEAHEGRK